MVKFSCLSALGCKKKIDVKEKKESLNTVNEKKELKTLQVKIERLAKTDESDEKKSGSFSILVPTAFGKSSSHKGKVMSHDSPIGGEIEEVAYEGEDELDDNVSMKRDFSDCDLQAHVVNTSEETDQPIKKWINNYNSFDTKSGYQSDNRTEKDVEDLVDMVQNGNLSDPGTRKAEFWASPKLKRSCSNLETREVLKKIDEKFPLSKSRSFEEMQRLAEIMSKEVLPGNLGSPDSTITHRSADKVMLKKRSSSQILPSRSRRLWWKLFLWSHRNLHESWTAKQLPVRAPLNQQGGYSSDTLEPNRGMRFGSPSSFTLNKGSKNDDNQSWDGFQGVSGLWPQNQWVAFPTESNSLTRVDEWVKELSSEPPFLDNDDLVEDGIIFSPSPDTGKSPARSTYELTPHQDMNLPDYILHASSVIQSLNSSSTVAHISGIGLKVIPAIWRFSSLRSVNLSANYIVHITPGSLPKGLHSLNLSRNKISTIEGLRELTRLRVLDLSYNRISRIGQGLSNCTLIKELYLAGNKISDIEGLHRLLKLTILDVSFNKITTTKALGQLVANYSSLQALNLLGNPIQNNINDDQLRKAVCSLLPKLAYLNKQPINPQKARELAAESIARAALGSSDRSARRKAVKRVCQGGSSAFSGQRSSASMSQKGRHRLKTRTYQQSPLKTK